jgi:ATP synthase regulation protein NCA2
MLKRIRIIIIGGVLSTFVSLVGQGPSIFDPQEFIASFEQVVTAIEQARTSAPSTGKDVDLHKSPDSGIIASHVHQGVLLKKVFIEILAIIDEAVVYWQDQKSSPFHHLMYKGPRYWIKGIKYTEKQIAENMTTLQRYQDHYATLLGKICHLMQQAKSANEEGLSSSEDGAWIELYKKAALKSFENLQVPSHFKRYWLEYAAACIGVSALGLYAYAKRDKITKLVDSVQQGTQKLIKDHVEEPAKNLLNVILDRDPKLEELKEQKEKSKNLKEIAAIDKAIQEHIEQQTFKKLDTSGARKDIIQQLKGYSGSREGQIAKALETFSNSLPSKEADKDGQYTEIKTLIIGVVTTLKRTDLDSKAKREKVEVPLGKFVNLLRAKVEGYLDYRKSIDLGFDLLQGILIQNLDVTIWDLFSLVENMVESPLSTGADNVEHNFNILQNDIQKIRNSLRLDTILLAAIPTVVAVGAAGWLIKKVFNIFKKRAKDFNPLRKTLADMHRILNKYTEAIIQELSDLDEGLQAYYAHKLSNQVTSLVEVGQINEVMRDVRDLTDNSLSSRQRVAVIDRMYRTYDFLGSTAKQ